MAKRLTTTPRLRGFARALRANATPEEDHLWELLRGRRFVGFKFRRQVAVGPYIVDFLCIGRRTVVELDGGQHGEDVDYDRRRDAELQAQGYKVLRVWNNELRENEVGVLEAVLATLQQ